MIHSSADGCFTELKGAGTCSHKLSIQQEDTTDWIVQGSYSAPSLKFANNIDEISKACQDTSSPTMQLDGEKSKLVYQFT